MNWDDTLNDLRDILAGLYPEPNEARILIESSGLQTVRISFQAAPSTMWHSILREAHNQRHVDLILKTANFQYSRNFELITAGNRYLQKHQTYYRYWSLKTMENAVPPNQTQNMASTKPPKFDLAIIAAMTDELDPLFHLTGRKETWDRIEIDNCICYHKEIAIENSMIRIVACSLWRYGDVPTVSAVHRMAKFAPSFLAMIGICAGWAGKDGIELGDVIVAEGAFNPREGKLKGTEFQPDPHVYMPAAWVLQQIKDALANSEWIDAIQEQRPLSLRYQGEWLLCKIANNQINLNRQNCPILDDDRFIASEAISWLEQNGYLENNNITQKGRNLLSQLKDAGTGDVEPRKDRDRPKAHSGVFASDASIVAISDPFSSLSAQVRSVRAYELEVKSFFQASAEVGIPAIAVKGVSDYGTQEKDDRYRKYSAEAACCWLLHLFKKSNLSQKSG